MGDAGRDLQGSKLSLRTTVTVDEVERELQDIAENLHRAILCC